MEYIAHHGIKGMKWGIRRYQRKDGSSTSLGKRHQEKLNDSYDNDSNESKKSSTTNTQHTERKGLTDKQKKAIKVGATAVGTVLAAYGTYKMSEAVKDKAFATVYSRGAKEINKYMKVTTSKSAAYTKGNKIVRSIAAKKFDNMYRDLNNQNFEYAKRASKNTYRALRTLLAQDYETFLM